MRTTHPSPVPFIDCFSPSEDREIGVYDQHSCAVSGLETAAEAALIWKSRNAVEADWFKA